MYFDGCVYCASAAPHRYEYEEHPGVCRALEHAAELFLVNAEIGNAVGAGVSTKQQEGSSEASTSSAAESAQ